VQGLITAGTGKNGIAAIGTTATNTWTVTSPCNDGACDATIQSDSGLTLTLTNSGATYVATVPRVGGCFDFDTGVATAQEVAAELTYSLTPTVVDGIVTGLTGTAIWQQKEPCDVQTEEFYSTTNQFTITRTGS
jgi:hypothetical protein